LTVYRAVIVSHTTGFKIKILARIEGGGCMVYANDRYHNQNLYAQHTDRL